MIIFENFRSLFSEFLKYNNSLKFSYLQTTPHLEVCSSSYGQNTKLLKIKSRMAVRGKAHGRYRRPESSDF